MLPVSSAFLGTVRGSHRIVVRARVITPGATGADPPGRDLAITDGTVTLDASADVRGTLDLTVAEAWPASVGTDELAPYGTEIAVSRGIVLGNGVIERAPLGIYRVTAVEQEDAPAGPLRVTGSDRMSGLIEAELVAPVQYLKTQTYADVVADLVQAVYPGQPIEWDDTSGSGTLGRTTIVEQDRFGFLRDMVTSLGKIFYFDYRGVLVIVDAPEATASVFDVDAGGGGVLVSASRSLTRQDVYNAVVATGEAMDDFAPATAVVVDADPTSATYWDGPFGKVPLFHSDPLIVTTAQATKAATQLLSANRGLPYSVDFSAVPNPALEPWDPVLVRYPPQAAASPHVAVETHVLEQVTVPLTPDAALTAKTRLVYRDAT